MNHYGVYVMSIVSILFRGAIVALLALPLVAQANTLKMADAADPVSLDPHEQLSGATLQMSHLLFDPLVRWSQELEFTPRLATGWQRIDETTMRFNLRQGVKFHSGNTLTSKDVAWTFDRLKESADFKVFLPLLRQSRSLMMTLLIWSPTVLFLCCSTA